MFINIMRSTFPACVEILVADPTFRPAPRSKQGKPNLEYDIQRRWKDMQAKICVQTMYLRRGLCLKKNLSILISHVQQWGDIFYNCHVDVVDGKHKSLVHTMDVVKSISIVGLRKYGIAESFVKASYEACLYCHEIREKVPRCALRTSRRTHVMSCH
ncbi:hypothetical protein O6H91_19G080600 [Diphasiastrum complanatum]|uniref:Uncharacterized protein n=1 Tax=Diphasiastrum complanatum TaxID=34168 RepID=A0ACC2AWY9_DIPCM|nr:hypothetical protein O6H91_19G080600 [Diphasiastrum complanatum]